MAIAPVAVGVDVQALACAQSAGEVAALLHPREREELAAADAAERGALFTRLWVRKEAYLKGRGTGIAHGVAEPYVGAGAKPAGPPAWTILDVPAGDGYAAAAAMAL